MRRSRQAGLTLLELLIASAIGLALLAVVAVLTSTSLRLQRQEGQNVPTQQALRASLELIAQDLRAAVGTRVTYSGMVTPSGVPATSSTQLVVLVPVPETTFAVPAPPGYPAAASRELTDNRLLTPITDPALENSSKTCAAVMAPATGQSAVYAMFYSTLDTSQPQNGVRSPDNSQLLQVGSLLPCLSLGGVTQLTHPLSPLPRVVWNPNTYLVQVQPVVYGVSGGNLTRQVLGIDSAPQVVAYGVTALALSYLAERNPGAPPTATASCNRDSYTASIACAPRSVTLSLTAAPQDAAVRGAQTMTASQIVFLR
jgi:type II secretory pathway pseudopilin PulG